MANYPIPSRVPLPTFNPNGQMGGSGFPPAPQMPQQAMTPGAAQPQQNGIWQKMMANPELFLSLGAGLLGGRTGPEQWSGGLGAMAQTMGAAKEKKLEAQKKNQTLDWLRKNAPEYADAVDQGVMSASDAYTEHRKALVPKKENIMSAGNGRFYNADTGEWITAPGGADGGPKYGMTPVYLQNPDGTVAAGQLTSDGQLSPSKLPDGYKVLSPYEKSRQTAQGGAEGKGKGEAAVAYESMASKMPGLEQVVSDLDALSEKASYTVAGQVYNSARTQLGMDPSEAGLARTEYIAKVDNQILPLLRDTFGAAFTEREGTSLKATLGDPNKSPAEKQAVLKAFIEQKRRDIEGMAREAGISPSATSGGNTGQTSSGVKWSVE